MRLFHLFLVSIFFVSFSFGQVRAIRWTAKDDPNGSLDQVVRRINQSSGLNLSASDFRLIETTQLANYDFVHYAQVSGGLPVRGQLLRLWLRPGTEALVQAEAHVDAPIPSRTLTLALTAPRISSAVTSRIIRFVIHRQGDDREIRGMSWQDEWQDQKLVRRIVVKAKRGKHIIVISALDGGLISSRYEEFPQADIQEFEVPAKVYPIWEEYDGVAYQGDTRVAASLKYIQSEIVKTDSDPYAALKTQRYLYSKFDPVRGLTEEGRKLGFWSIGYVRSLANNIYAELPRVANDLGGEGAFLSGRYATINLHPDIQKVSGVSGPFTASAQFRPNWVPATDNPMDYEMIPQAGLLGKRLVGDTDALTRLARRLPNHDVVQYLNDGFDEIQVYWAVTQLFDSLRPMGFTDPGLSTRPFHAYLFDPDISMRDNAYYTDDTINFTTYSSSQHNMARDNSTIWHELGHGVMDRLMGDHIVLADTGGLAEGMADFIAQLVINERFKRGSFTGKNQLRIFNHTGFHLTNESHDDGEAYGGAMNDMLVSAMALEGEEGLRKVTDLTLEAMRLTRNHPGLTANGWFEHMLFADELGNLPVRRPGELRNLIVHSLEGRNFNLDGSEVAEFHLRYAGQDVTATSLASRSNPIPVRLGANEEKAFPISVSVKNSVHYEFRFPVTVKVSLRGGPLQGGVHWKGEENTPLLFTLSSEADVANIELSAEGTCDEINRPDNSCVDFAYVQIWNSGEGDKPQAKKRFYLRVYPKTR